MPVVEVEIEAPSIEVQIDVEPLFIDEEIEGSRRLKSDSN